MKITENLIIFDIYGIVNRRFYAEIQRYSYELEIMIENGCVRNAE